MFPNAGLDAALPSVLGAARATTTARQSQSDVVFRCAARIAQTRLNLTSAYADANHDGRRCYRHGAVAAVESREGSYGGHPEQHRV